MNFYIIFSVLVLSSIVSESESICVSKNTDWGEIGAFFTDPLCDVWCRMRFCGKGVCRENRTSFRRNQAECICEKCNRGSFDDNAYTDRDGGYQQQSRLNFDGPSTSSAQGRNQDDLYPSQNRFQDDWN